MNKNTMITTVIFDMGNVLIEFRWRKLFAEMGLTGERFERMANATVLDPVWNEFDRGIWTDEMMLDAFIKNAPELEKEMRLLMGEYFPGLLRKYDYTDEWLDAIKAKGYRIFILSNFSRKAFTDCADELDYVKKADVPIISYMVNLIKPDPKIYEYMINTYGLDPKEAVFIDDSPANIEAAKKFGLNTILFTDKASADAKLKELGVKY
ncbi:MAG: HAD family phosphatase [Lachnospiraceae bacterium]|nr:HAD family phosphatase [Lachnospiraceae bacterium]